MKEKRMKTGFRLSRDSYIYDVTDRDTSEDWVRNDTQTEWSVDGISIDNESPEMLGTFEAKNGDIVYALYAIYDSGDSFHRSYSAYLEPLIVFKTFDKAKKAARLLEECKEFSLEVETEDGSLEKVYVPWNGYFDSLVRLEVEEFVIKPI